MYFYTGSLNVITKETMELGDEEGVCEEIKVEIGKVTPHTI